MNIALLVIGFSIGWVISDALKLMFAGISPVWGRWRILTYMLIAITVGGIYYMMGWIQ